MDGLIDLTTKDIVDDLIHFFGRDVDASAGSILKETNISELHLQINNACALLFVL